MKIGLSNFFFSFLGFSARLLRKQYLSTKILKNLKLCNRGKTKKDVRREGNSATMLECREKGKKESEQFCTRVVLSENASDQDGKDRVHLRLYYDARTKRGSTKMSGG